MSLLDRRCNLATSIFDSTTVTETGNGSAFRLPDPVGRSTEGIVFVLDLTAAATDVVDTLNVYVQTKADGTNWVDVVAFTQCLGNGGAKRHIGKISNNGSLTMFENGTALTAGAVRNIVGDEWRVRYAITDAGTDNASFTFSVDAMVM